MNNNNNNNNYSSNQNNSEDVLPPLRQLLLKLFPNQIEYIFSPKICSQDNIYSNFEYQLHDKSSCKNTPSPPPSPSISSSNSPCIDDFIIAKYSISECILNFTSNPHINNNSINKYSYNYIQMCKNYNQQQQQQHQQQQ